jgi:hypothetical protein
MNAFKTKLLLVACVAGSAIVLGGLALNDLQRARADKQHIAVQRARTLDVAAAIMLFENTRGHLPAQLKDLVPGFMPHDMLSVQAGRSDPSRIALQWDKRAAALRPARPLRVAGLFNKDVSFSIPVPRATSKTEDDQSSDIIIDPLHHAGLFNKDVSLSVPVPRSTSKTEDDQSSEIIIAPPPSNGSGFTETHITNSLSMRRTAPEQGLVIEAEHFQQMSYGWEIVEDATASGGAALHIKEGVGDMESEYAIRADPKRRAGDFFNINGNQKPIEVRHYFKLGAAGSYTLWARTMAHRFVCSNIITASVNGSRRRHIGDNYTRPYVWLWHRVGQYAMRAGVNWIALRTYQDDVKIDQFVLSPASHLDVSQSSPWAYQSDRDVSPEPRPDWMPPVTLSLSAPRLQLQDGVAPEIRAYVRNNTKQSFKGTLVVQMDKPDGGVHESRTPLNLANDHVLTRVSLELPWPDKLALREYVVRANVEPDVGGGADVTERVLVLNRGYDWLLLGRLPYMSVRSPGPIEHATPPFESTYNVWGKSAGWQRFSPAHADAFGLLDFGMVYDGRHLNATPRASVYAVTEIDVAEAGTYRFKVLGDDNVVVWIDQKRILALTEKGPPIRTAREVNAVLKAGRHMIVMRVNQRTGQFEAGLRIRNDDHSLPNIVGIAFDNQRIINASSEPNQP